MANEKNIGRAVTAVYALIFIVMLVFNFLTPMASDDYAHYFGMEGEHVTSLSGILHNMVIFRSETNGRVVPHFLVYLFLALPKFVFNLVNAAVPVMIGVLLSRFYARKKDLKMLCLLLCATFSLWIFTPSFGEIYLWLTGAVNYSWGLMLDLLLIYPFFCAYTERPCAVLDEKKTGIRILYVLLALLTGAYSENGATASICVIALLGLLIWIRDRKFPKYLFLVFLCAFAGFVFLMTAPATLSTRAGGDIREHIWYCRVLTGKFMTVLLAIYAVLLILSIIGKADRKIIVISFLLVFAAGLSILVFIFAAYLPNRSFMIAVSFTILANLCLMSELWEKPKGRLTALLPAAAAVFFLISFPKGAADVFYLNRLQTEREEIIAAAVSEGTLDVTIPRFVTDTDYTACPEEDLSTDSSYWYNDVVARYYHLNTVTAG